MKKLFLKYLWLTVTTCTMSSQGLFSNESIVGNSSRMNSLHNTDLELVLLVSADDLQIDQENITIAIEGASYPIRSLQRVGNEWIATVSRNAMNNCKRGHPLCKICGLCHKEGCYYYVAPCWK